MQIISQSSIIFINIVLSQPRMISRESIDKVKYCAILNKYKKGNLINFHKVHLLTVCVDMMFHEYCVLAVA